MAERGRRSRPMNLSIRISVQEMEDLRKVAHELDRTVSWVAGLAIRNFLYKEQKEQAPEEDCGVKTPTN